MHRLTQGIIHKIEIEEANFDLYQTNAPRVKPKSSIFTNCWISFKNAFCFLYDLMCSSTKKVPVIKDRTVHRSQILSPIALGKVKDQDLHIIKTANLPVIWIMGGPACPIVELINHLARNYNFHHVNVGEIVKDEISVESQEFELTNSLLERGIVMPRIYLLEMIKRNMVKAIKEYNSKGFIFGDFPSSYAQAKAFIKTVITTAQQSRFKFLTFSFEVTDVDFVIVLKFNENTMKLCALNQLNLQLNASVHLSRTEEELKEKATEWVKEYNNDVAKMYRRMGYKMQAIDANEKLGSFYRNVTKWIERSMILHNVRPPDVTVL